MSGVNVHFFCIFASFVSTLKLNFKTKLLKNVNSDKNATKKIRHGLNFWMSSFMIMILHPLFIPSFPPSFPPFWTYWDNLRSSTHRCKIMQFKTYHPTCFQKLVPICSHCTLSLPAENIRSSFIKHVSISFRWLFELIKLIAPEF